MSTLITPVQFYQFLNDFSSLAIAPQQPTVAGSPLVQVPATPVSPEMLWGFIDAGTNQYRIFNFFSGLSIDARGNNNPPFDGEIVQQSQWVAGQGNQEWYVTGTTLNDIFFESSYDSNMVWEIKGHSLQPGDIVVLRNKTGDPSQRFRLIPVATEVVAAARSAAT